MPLFRKGNTLGLQTQQPREETEERQELPYVTPTQFNDSLSSLRTETSSLINGAVAELRGMFQGFQSQMRPQPEVREPQVDDITDEEYQNALSTGDTVALGRRQRAVEERARRQAAREVQQARAELTPIVEGMSTELASSILGTLPFYSLFKKEVDEMMSTIPPAQRNRSVIEHIYHSVCGRPESLAKIDTYRETQRKQREVEEAMASGVGTQRRGQREREVTFESTFGEQISNPTATIQGSGPIWQGRRRGYDPDSYARDQGFNDKEDFTRFTHAVMSVEDCPLCLSPVIGGRCAAYCKGNKIRGQR